MQTEKSVSCKKWWLGEPSFIFQMNTLQIQGLARWAQKHQVTQNATPSQITSVTTKWPKQIPQETETSDTTHTSPYQHSLKQECLAQVHVEVAWVTTADLLGLQITERHTTAFFSSSPSTQGPENSLDLRSTVHNLFSFMNVSSLAGLLIFRKWEGRTAAQTFA